MNEIFTIFQKAHQFLDALLVRRDFKEAYLHLHKDCTMLGPCDIEFLSSRKTIGAHFEDVLKDIEECVVSNQKFEIATQNTLQVTLMMAYTLSYSIGDSTERNGLNQHCTMIMERETGLIQHLNMSDTLESVMKRGETLNLELASQRQNSILRLLEQKNEIIQMIDANTSCGLKGSNDDATFSFYYVNEGLYRMLGYNYEEFMEMSKGSAVGMVYPPDLPKALGDVAKCFATGDAYSSEYRIRKKDGSLMWVIDSGRKHISKNGKTQINSILMDITQLKHSQINLEVERERYRVALENITDVMFEYDVINDCMVKYAKKDNNPKNPVEEVEMPHYMSYLERDHYIHLDDVGHLKAILLDALDEKQMSIRMFHDDEWRWVELQCSHVYEDHQPIKCIGIWRDVTDEKMKMEQLIDMTQRDPLTGLYHQKSVEDKIQSVLDTQSSSAMLIMDIDKFKIVNDTFGHLKGNDLLLTVKKILLDECSECEYVCRIGGDEFMVFFPENMSENVLLFANNILRKVKEINIDLMHITISIGIAYARKGEMFKKLFSKADHAMYEAKKNGRNRIEIAK